jgi:hypothetical protein
VTHDLSEARQLELSAVGLGIFTEKEHVLHRAVPWAEKPELLGAVHFHPNRNHVLIEHAA